MSKWLRKEKARACPVHMQVLEASAKQLELHGVFNKDTVLSGLNLSAMTDAIRWDYIREFLQDEQGCELVPLAAAYFKRHKVTEEHVNPAKFLAQGHGKKTAGYAAVVPDNDHLVVERLKCRQAMANGVGVAFQDYLVATEKRRVATGSVDLTAIEGGAG